MTDVTLRFDNVKAEVEGGPVVRAAVDQILSYRAPGYRFTTAYKRGHWDGWRHLLKHDRFPAGLVFDVAKGLRRDGYEVILSDERGDPPAALDEIQSIVNDIKLDPHQQGAIDSIRRHSRGIVAQDVSAGKSVIIPEAVRQLGVGGLVVVGRAELLRQQYDQFVNLANFPPKLVGKIGDGHWSPSLVTVAMIQTLRHRLSNMATAGETMAWLREIPSLHVDECHHLPAESYAMLTNTMTKAYYRAGYSATPHKSRTDKAVNREAYLNVTGLIGPVISSLSASENVETGRAVGAEIFWIDTPGKDPDEIDGYIEYTDKEGRKKRRPRYSYPKAVRSGIIDNEPRNQMIAKLAQRLSRHGPTIVLCNRIEHGKILKSLLAEAGLEEVK